MTILDLIFFMVMIAVVIGAYLYRKKRNDRE